MSLSGGPLSDLLGLLRSLDTGLWGFCIPGTGHSAKARAPSAERCPPRSRASSRVRGPACAVPPDAVMESKNKTASPSWSLCCRDINKLHSNCVLGECAVSREALVKASFLAALGGSWRKLADRRPGRRKCVTGGGPCFLAPVFSASWQWSELPRLLLADRALRHCPAGFLTSWTFSLREVGCSCPQQLIQRMWGTFSVYLAGLCFRLTLSSVQTGVFP